MMPDTHANWSYPTPIRFGAGRIAEVAEACAAAGITSPLFVTDKGLANAPITEAALSYLPGAGAFSEVDPNPDEQSLSAGIARFIGGGHDGVVAFGGGSALDLGKLIALMAEQSVEVWDLEDVDDWWTRADAERIYPSVAVPTTAGTGSEVGRAGVLTNSVTLEKKIIYHPKVMPSVVICDPALTTSMPAHITAGTGMDAFAHCLEAYSSPHYHPMSQGIALEGMRIVKDNLLRAYQTPDDLTARGEMMSAALMGATGFQKGLGAIHALSHPIGAVHHTHHGMTNAVVMRHVLAFNRSAIEPRIETAAAYLGIGGGFDGFVGFVSEMCEALQLPKTLTALGVVDPDIPSLTEKALADPTCGGNPIPLTRETVTALYEACL
jgi:alcohol dehydrogenase class IV